MITSDSVKLTIYMDVCCLNRPFDNLSHDRVRMEAEAVKAIMLRIGRGEWDGVKSSTTILEIMRMPDQDRLIEVGLMANDLKQTVSPGVAENERAVALGRMGFMALDAMHLACAERARADVFLTTDDDILRIASREGERIKVKVENPLSWFNRTVGK